jgi:hypothetical protein
MKTILDYALAYSHKSYSVILMVCKDKKPAINFNFCTLMYMKRYTSTGLSLPTDLAHRIGRDRGDISRSRYLRYSGRQMSNATKIPHLVFDQYPAGCITCGKIYVNEQIGHRIVCKCKTSGHNKSIQKRAGL